LLKTLNKAKGSIGPAFAVRIRTENQDQASICPFALREVSVLAELALGHLRYLLTDVPPQSNSPPEAVLGGDRAAVSKPQGLCPPRTLDSRNEESIDSAFHLTESVKKL
jgi:hypothetical protein